MIPALKKQWLTALRSGDYKQTRGTLKSGEGYCCLGVLVNLLPEDINIKREAGGITIRESKGKSANSTYVTGTLPIWLRKKVAMEKQLHQLLTVMNDGSESSAPQDFFQIADWIETNIPETGEAPNGND